MVFFRRREVLRMPLPPMHKNRTTPPRVQHLWPMSHHTILQFHVSNPRLELAQTHMLPKTTTHVHSRAPRPVISVSCSQMRVEQFCDPLFYWVLGTAAVWTFSVFFWFCLKSVGSPALGNCQRFLKFLNKGIH